MTKVELRWAIPGRRYAPCVERSLRASFLVLGIWSLAGAWSLMFGASPPLTTAQQVLDLGAEAARYSLLPVRLEGAVTYPDPGANTIFVQDNSAGIRICYTNVDWQPAFGQMVVVEGSVAPGMPSPFVDCSNVRVIGTSPIPAPCEAAAARLVAGELFGQWVRVEGVVRDVVKEPERARLFLSSGGWRFHAIIQPFPGLAVPTEWLDARVILEGVCTTDLDAENKPIGFTLYVPGTNHAVFSLLTERDIFRQPALTMRSQRELLRQSDARVKVAGVVAFHSLSGYLYLEGESGAVSARLLAPLARGNPQARHVERAPVVPQRPGALVELVGSPTDATVTPLLQDAEFRQVGEGPAPAAQPVTATEALSGRFDGRLVSIKARLLGSETRPARALKHQVLAMQSGDTIFEALWEFAGTNTLPTWTRNSYVQATGICAVELGELNQIRSFRVLLRDGTDLRLLRQPPWWEPFPVGRMLSAGLALGGVGLVWIWLLRRQVSQRTAELEAEVVRRQRAQTELHHALAAERELGELRSRFVSLVSHEFRTPLGVILSAAENLDSYFERLQPEQRRQQLHHVIQATRQMGKVMENVLLLGRAEAGKVEFNPAPIGLAGFCQSLAEQIRSTTDSRSGIHFRAGPLAPARGDEGLLRHILLNLLTNAVKYSPPGAAVEFTLEQDEAEAIFRVADQGIGIPAADQKQLFNAFHRGRNASHLPGTGLGLVIVKRCVELHRGRIACESVEGAGTTFTVRLPLFEQPS